MKRTRGVSSGKSKPTQTTNTKKEVATVSPVAVKTSGSNLVCRSALLVVGNYHAVMAGLVLKKEKFYLKFAIKHHVGNVNDVAVTDRYVASCGADERVFLFTNKAEQKLTPAQRAKLQAAGETMAVRLADLGSLTPPCEVRCLCFTTGSQYLLCGCADGQLLVYRTRDWMLVNNLDVHEKELLSLAVHPQSGGTLVVSVGADRSVAVLDLAKGRLLTKWKYSPVIANAEADGSDDAKEKKRAKPEKESANPLARLFAREEPVKVVFSPEGGRFAIQARFSFVVYSTSSMQPLRAVQLTQPPQPSEEIHSILFVDESTVLVGNESAAILYGRLDREDGVVELRPVSVSYPDSVRAEAERLIATPIHTDAEVRKKNPLRHVSRVKALRKVGKSLFSLDSNGVVFSWTLQSDAQDGSVRLLYVTSANCQGRATSLDVLQL